jgi:hypothetical protein
LVTVSSKVRASFSSSTTRGLTGCTGHSQFSLGSLGSDRAMLAHEVAQRTDAVATRAAGSGVAGHVGDAPGAVGDGLEHIAVGYHRAVAHVHLGHLVGSANRDISQRSDPGHLIQVSLP